MFTLPRAVLLTALFPGFCLSGADVAMKVTDNGYLDTQGFSVILYQDTYHPIFVDEKNAAMEMILHGQRIATNGDRAPDAHARSSGTWSRKLKGQQADKEHNRLTANLSFPTYQMDYRLEVAAEPGGVRVSVNLDKPLPEKLAGRAGFNLEFLPSIYMGKSYAVDGSAFGVIPRSPQDPMQKVAAVRRRSEEAAVPGGMGPRRRATRSRFRSPPETALRWRRKIRCTASRSASETGPVSLYDGRNRAQNGWFVLRTLIPSGKTEGAVVWHIRPDVIPNWTRPPMVAHSQAGYPPDFPKVAVIELDPKFDAPKTAKVLRLGEDGSYKQVFEGPISAPTPWLRYTYAKFDFSSVKDPGLYAIEYAGQRTDLFPIAKDVYSRTWQSSLDGFLAVEMDHVSVREGYRLWHGVSHLDDARQAPPNTQHFDGYSMGPNLDSPFQPGEHIPGLNVGGWFDAGDYDNIAPSQYSVIQNLALAYREFDLKWDELTVDENGPHGGDAPAGRSSGRGPAGQARRSAGARADQGHRPPDSWASSSPPCASTRTWAMPRRTPTGASTRRSSGPTRWTGTSPASPDDRWAFTTKMRESCNTAPRHRWPPRRAC